MITASRLFFVVSLFTLAMGLLHLKLPRMTWVL